uniref:Uncharacterized protein n=1 Tax=Spongospora subterranea TaxID=70186 RepID=A0A0H5QI17_9EUKA|eukprot:CRZ01700.1 hypothetical protein [Spongospora subterranea]
MVVVKAGQIDPSFRRKTARAKDQSFRRFLAANHFAIRIATHEAQRSPQETSELAIEFVTSIRPRLLMPNRQAGFISEYGHLMWSLHATGLSHVVFSITWSINEGCQLMT